MVLPVVRLLSQSYYDNSFEYTQVEDIAKEIARKHTYYNAADKTVEIELNQDLINSIIKDNLDSLGVKISGGTIRDLMFNTEKQRLYVNVKYGIFRIPLSFLINVDYSEEGIKIWGSDTRMGKRKAPGFVKKQVPMDMIAFEVNYEEMGIPDVFTLNEIRFRPGYTLLKAELLPENIADLAIEQRVDLVEGIDDFKKEQPSFLQTFIDKIMENDVLSDDKIKEYVDSVLSNGEVVNSAIHFAMADDPDKYTTALENCRNTVEEWASPLETVKLDGSIEEAVESILYNEPLKEFASWFIPAGTLCEYTDTAEGVYDNWKESQNLFQAGNYESSIENLLYSDNAVELVSWFVPQDTAKRYFDDARSYYGLYSTTKTLIENGDYELAFENVIYDENTEKLIAQFTNNENAAELLAVADDGYRIYKASNHLLQDRDYDGIFEYFAYGDDMPVLLSHFISQYYVDEYSNTADELFELYKSSSQYLSERDYEKAVEYIIHDNKVSNLLSRFVPSDYIDTCTSAAADAFDVYLASKPMFEEGDYVAATEHIVTSEKTESFLNRILPQSLTEGIKSELDHTMDRIDMATINDYADWTNEYCIVRAENIRKDISNEIGRINTKDLEEVFIYIENDDGKAGEYVKSIDSVYYSNFKDYLNEATWLKNTVRDYVDSLDFSSAEDYAFVIEDVTDFVSALHSKDYYGAFKIATKSKVPDLLADIAGYYS